MDRCDVLLENGWRVVLKVKWRRGQDTPPTLLDGADYLAGLAHLLDEWAGRAQLAARDSHHGQ